ncbi:N-acetylmuramoyl-L-alanine amidase [Muriicola sp. Z0-33]|uniref:N-acetylmuramoyl-L-alanine amidase family protein n=1 Tax=Muriicola sp. Z0-33 TaxID=2816957 RepID=UPI0039E11FED
MILFLVFSGVLTSFTTAVDSSPEVNDFIVVLDAGHGGHDPGNLGNGYLEKNIALKIVLEVGQALQAQPGIKVIYTRKDDSFVDLYVRGEIANKANADLFVSVHCDSHSSDANGAGTFVLGLHANKQNFEIAKKENSAIYLEDNYETRYAQYDINSPESIIGLTIMQEEFLDQSIMLAKMMQDNFSNKLKRNDRKVKQAGFIVLHQTFMPSVLIETGFLTNKNEGGYLNSRKGQSEMGKAIAEAVVNYKNSVRGGVVQPSVISTPEPPAPEAKKVEEIAEIPDNTEPSEEEAKASQTSDKKDIVAIEKEIKTAQPVEEAPITEKAESEAKDTTPPEVKEEVVKAIPEKKEPPKIVEPPKKTVPNAEKPEPKTAVAEAKKPAVDIVFKVQLLASSKDLPLRSEDFKGLNQLSKEPYKNLFRYLYGNVRLYKQAELLQKNAALKGYTTAYIVAYKEGERIPVPEAVKYLKDQ